MVTKNATWQEAAAAWQSGELVCSVELGGLGPGYEQAIQLLLFEIMARWPKDAPVPTGEGFIPPSFRKHADQVTAQLDERLGFSGAQAAIAQATAYQFMRYGYGHMLAKPEVKDRLIQVRRYWPSLA